MSPCETKVRMSFLWYIRKSHAQSTMARIFKCHSTIWQPFQVKCKKSNSHDDSFKSRFVVRNSKNVPTKKLVWGIRDIWRFWMIPNWSMGDLFNNLESIWYHSEPLEVSYSKTSFLVGTFFAISYSKSALAS